MKKEAKMIEGYAYMDAGNYTSAKPNFRGIVRSIVASGEQQSYPVGLDISHWDGVGIDWGKLSANANFLFVKASESIGYKDDRFKDNWKQSKARGMLRGAYHFLRQIDPIRQAKNFVEQLDGDWGELPPVCDVEDRGLNLDVCNVWCEKVEELTGVRPIIYTGYYIWLDCGGANKAWGSKYDLWIANYRVKKPLVPKPWTSYKFWQFDDRGDPTKYGIVQKKEVDLNYWMGTLDELKNYAKKPTNQNPNVPLPISDAEKLKKLWDSHPELWNK